MSNIYFNVVQVDFMDLTQETWERVSGMAQTSFSSNVISATAGIQAVELWNSSAMTIQALGAEVSNIVVSGPEVTFSVTAQLNNSGDQEDPGPRFNQQASYMRVCVMAECE